MNEERAEMLMCEQLGGKEVYETWDIVEVWEWLAIKLVVNYE